MTLAIQYGLDGGDIWKLEERASAPDISIEIGCLNCIPPSSETVVFHC